MAALTRALAIYDAPTWRNHPEAAVCRFELARLYDRRGEYARADLLYRSALEIRRKTYASLHKSLAESYNAAGELDRRHGRYAEAEALLNLVDQGIGLGKEQAGIDCEDVRQRGQLVAQLAERVERGDAGRLKAGHDGKLGAVGLRGPAEDRLGCGALELAIERRKQEAGIDSGHSVSDS